MNKDIDKPNIILASFPRSGNTFLRNVLYEVYGIYSWNSIEIYNKSIEKLQNLSERKQKKGKLNEKAEFRLSELQSKFNFLVLKSHELPSKTLRLCAKENHIIYLVRDGRDALISMAHHRKDIVEPGTDFTKNLKSAIRAPFGSYFGGWSRNVEQWTKLADIVIKFEDFILDPLKYTESFRSFMDMPEPLADKIPTFESQRNGDAFFGGNERQKYTESEKHEFNNLFFRRGKVGEWKNEMSEKLQRMFWKKHGNTLEKMGYTKDE
ncbi:MAG: hypothetical protein HN704_13270 [Bacteroidetes bacterium]|jgi:hypothetical protein|nr:hypothetical protein [Bacteroidota bacterium]MBT6687048.1 hypothetical protein [Bacteroidota bacterium]MBT7144120.1 hypothetical protein [Bacteroidota bacterium]MBT7492567.1 hypothetical protein [Bacteroidota bacterium]